ncbi:unnamed protein product [Agarophyton chilense]
MIHNASVSPRRPIRSRHHRWVRIAPCATTPVPDTQTLKQQLEAILEGIPRFLDNASNRVEKAVTDIPDQVKYLFSEEGPLGVLTFWRENKDNISNTGQQLLESGERLAKGDAKGFREKASGINLSWLRPVRRLGSSESLDDATIVTDQVRKTVLFLIDSLTPWDFDRHDFGLTFATVWNDVDTSKSADVRVPSLKMTSTIKPVEQEWKLSARGKLFALGENAMVFGKAGLYLAGDKAAYIGAEADRVWSIPRLPNTKIFANANYRSSRKPQAEPFKVSCGIQQDLEVAKGLELTLRIALNLTEKLGFSVYPVPNGIKSPSFWEMSAIFFDERKKTHNNGLIFRLIRSFCTSIMFEWSENPLPAR